VLSVWGAQVVRDHKKVGNAWCRLLTSKILQRNAVFAAHQLNSTKQGHQDIVCQNGIVV